MSGIRFWYVCCWGMTTAEQKPPLLGAVRMSQGACGCWKLSHLLYCLYRYSILQGLFRFIKDGSLAVVTGLVVATVSLQMKVILSHTEVKRVCIYRRDSSVLDLHDWPSLPIKKVCDWWHGWVSASFIVRLTVKAGLIKVFLHNVLQYLTCKWLVSVEHDLFVGSKPDE